MTQITTDDVRFNLAPARSALQLEALKSRCHESICSNMSLRSALLCRSNHHSLWTRTDLNLSVHDLDIPVILQCNDSTLSTMFRHKLNASCFPTSSLPGCRFDARSCQPASDNLFSQPRLPLIMYIGDGRIYLQQVHANGEIRDRWEVG